MLKRARRCAVAFPIPSNCDPREQAIVLMGGHPVCDSKQDFRNTPPTAIIEFVCRDGFNFQCKWQFDSSKPVLPFGECASMSTNAPFGPGISKDQVLQERIFDFYHVL